MKSRGQFSKITETACLSGWPAGSSKQTKAGTAFTLPAIEMEWISIECSAYAASVERAQSSLGEQFLRFSKKITLNSWFDRIFHLFDTRKSCVFQIFLLRSIKKLICVQVLSVLKAWILLSVTLKKWYVSFDAQCTLPSSRSAIICLMHSYFNALIL